jgi:hypothetical protein
MIYEVKGQYGDAVAAELTYTEPPPDAAALRTAFETGGWRAYQEARVRYLLPRSALECSKTPAMSYLRLGNRAEAFRWLNHAVDNHCDILAWASDARLDPIREDERFRALLRRVHLPLPQESRVPASPDTALRVYWHYRECLEDSLMRSFLRLRAVKSVTPESQASPRPPCFPDHAAGWHELTLRSQETRSDEALLMSLISGQV